MIFLIVAILSILTQCLSGVEVSVPVGINKVTLVLNYNAIIDSKQEQALAEAVDYIETDDDFFKYVVFICDSKLEAELLQQYYYPKVK